MRKRMITGGSTKELRNYAIDAMLVSKDDDYYTEKKPSMFQRLFYSGDTHQFSDAYSWLIAEIALEIDKRTPASGDVVLQYVQQAFKETLREYPAYCKTYSEERNWSNHYPPFAQYIRAFVPPKVKDMLDAHAFKIGTDGPKVKH